MKQYQKTPLKLWSMIWQDYRFALIKVISLNILNAIVGVAVIAFINHNMLKSQQFSYLDFILFFVAIILLLFTTFISQYALTQLGHQFVYQLRQRLTDGILTQSWQRIEALGKSKLTASLSTDIQALTVAFVRLPELIQGFIFCLAAGLYLAYLSLPLFILVLFWVIVTIWVSLKLVNQVYHYLARLRIHQDEIYKDYQHIIEGHKELSLNQYRAEHHRQQLQKHAKAYQDEIIKADSYHLFAVNWSNIMMFASIGLVLGLAHLWQMADLAVATTFCLTLLFIQSPLLKAVGAYPTLNTAQIALDKIAELDLMQQPFALKQNSYLPLDWQTLKFENIQFRYPNHHAQQFSLEQVNFEIQRGEVVFLIGANGSGKSTFAKIFTGLYQPTAGQIYLDQHQIDEHTQFDYRQLFSAIYSDFYLFHHILGQAGQAADETLLTTWLGELQLNHKIQIQHAEIDQIELSQGQKKRIALLLSILEQKEIILLDEWAADQDPTFRRYFYLDIVPKLKAMGKTLLLISHDNQYFAMADRLILMKNGQLSELTGQQREQASLDAIGQL